ncbi:MAG: helix-turn-helix domain-containing protein [Gemmatimonadetes bacterium]|nr:helix-turn-helix domain-containing protein [Gemmatimonadota bacterium]
MIMMTHEWMLERFYARDPASNGRFVTGVLTTGIYCLPSCTARKPLPQNVRFFGTEDEARSAGLRPCRRCRPDHFYQQYDPDIHLLQTLAADVRRSPSAFADAAALVAASGIGTTKLNALFRRHFHATPAAFLARERVAAASRSLAAGATVTEAAYAAGFESLSAFHLNFRRLTGLTPGEYRALGASPSFAVALPEGFRADAVLAYQGRDPASVVERVRGSELTKAIRLGDGPAVLRMRFDADSAVCAVDAAGPLGAGQMREAHATAVRMLNLPCDPSAFERQVARQPELAPLIAPRRGMRIPLTATPWECLVWTIVGQQVNLPFAYALRTTVAELAGEAVGGGLHAHPTPEAVAALDYADLTSRRFSRRKAEYLIDLARMIAGGELRIDAEREMATAVERRMLDVRGLGPWSVQYFLMRGCGFADCVPVGDAGLTAALQRCHDLDHRPGPAETRDLMEPFAPFRSLGTFHLWSSLGDPQ